jgi:sigma-B regulation protein RsbU (phosphoserine phosphatase)
MLHGRRPWREELAIIDRTMKAISGITDPEEMVNAYFEGIGELMPVHDYVSVSRRELPPPFYRVTRSSRFTEHFNPWTQRDRLPVLTGGLLGEIAYANEPVVLVDVPSRLRHDDPGRFYLEGFKSLVALPTYDRGEGLNVTALLMPEGTEIDPAAIPMLHWQSGLFGRGTNNLVLRNQLAAALAALDRELQTVGEIQRSLLPSALPKIDGFEFAAYYQTSARAGGDYYDFFPLSDRRSWGLFIADVSGHGTPAAVLMAITHAIAHSDPGTHTPPDVLLNHLNDRLTGSYTHGGTFITAFYAVLDPVARTLTYSRAGHNPPRLVRGDSVISVEQSGALPLGILCDQPFEQSRMTLEHGDLLLLYTDGITEAVAPATNSTGTGSGTGSGSGRRLFGVERLDELLLTCRGHTADDCVRKIRGAIADFTHDAPPTDDQTLIAIRCL